MRNRFDHLAKQIGQKALGPSGTTVTQGAINPEPFSGAFGLIHSAAGS